ncbi:outer membrane beta-barrel protein [Mucilaginibacter corticis]|uniref:Outer membrane beta-barrel protein n=1 Tax=Mucilaginibacter corticis TaxID=2597670 RepID=A0A556MFU7_9SPHI|nr:outer membrane beta-barrel protein [Mucilaginibacter corticis]TSJ38811.1 outer membrane beta-barrel protein [Mucilaginibacter corticis]
MPQKLIVLFAMLFCMYAGKLHAQKSVNVKGNITDSTSAPLEGANIRIVSSTDSFKLTSDAKGFFTFHSIKQQSFQLKVSYLGYLDFVKNVTAPDNGDEINFGTIILLTDAKNLKEVVIKNKARPIVLKKDTIEYNVASYHKSDEEMVQDLLKRLPGLTVDKDGNLTSEGKPVTKIRVNGKDFFTGNVSEFIKQLPVGILSKVQIVNDYGDDAAFTGIKKTSTQTLNLVTKPGMDNGMFGNFSTTAGTNKQLGTGASGNYWRSSRQISASGDIRTAKNTVGSNTYNSMGFGYGDELAKKLNIRANYNYNNTKSSAQNKTFTQTVNSIGQIDNDVNSITASRNNQHNLNANLNYVPDTISYISFNANIGLNRTNDTSFSNAQQTGVIKQGLITGNSGNAKSPRANAGLTIGRNLNRTNRLTATLQYSTDNTSSNNQINRNIRYYDTLGTFKKDSTFNSMVINTAHSQNVSINIIYTKILSKKSNIDLTYSFNKNTQKTVLETDLVKPLKGLARIDSLSSNSSNSFSISRLDLNYRFSGPKLNMTDGIAIQRNAMSGFYKQNDKVSISTYNLSPVFNVSYSPSVENQFSMSYYGFSQSPSLEQLQPVRDTHDLQNVIIGNPDLKPSFNHSISSNYRHSSPKGQLISFSLNTSFSQNQIISNTKIEKDTLNSLKQITTYLNASGTNNVMGTYEWSIPIKIGKNVLSTSFSGIVNLGRQVVYTDNLKSFNNTRNLSQNIRTMLNLDKFGTDIVVTYMQSYNHYTVGQGLNNTTSQLTINWGGRLNFANTWINANISKSYIHGYTNIGANNPLIANASVQQSLFKNKLSLNLQVNDIFNQSNMVTQQVSGNSIISNKSSYITRYITFTCVYHISKFGIFRK